MSTNLKIARWVWVVLTVQLIGLLVWAGYHETVRRTAPTVLLKTRPVDPRDILRGDYMILSYEISRAEKTVVRADNLTGDVYVMLKPEGKYHVIEEVLSEEPDATEPRMWVKATAQGGFGDLRLDYGIERYFVPEGQGRPSFKLMEIEASVSAQHRLYIHRVFLDGKRFP
jgi:uncharacterized membrane-anchored protein